MYTLHLYRQGGGALKENKEEAYVYSCVAGPELPPSKRWKTSAATSVPFPASHPSVYTPQQPQDIRNGGAGRGEGEGGRGVMKTTDLSNRRQDVGDYDRVHASSHVMGHPQGGGRPGFETRPYAYQSGRREQGYDSTPHRE